MKTNSISFGTTYIKPSINHLSKANKEKVKKLIPLGQIYPVDLFLGADRKGNLTLEIKQTFIYDHLIANDQLDLTPQNIAMYKISKAAQNTFNYIHGDKTPVRKATIEHLDAIPKDILPYYVADEIEEYEKTYSKNFYC